MKALKTLNKAVPKILKVLSKHFGVKVTIFFPTSLDPMYGGKGSNITYNDEPTYEELMLIPALVKEKPSGFQGIIDPFLDGDEHILYLSGVTLLPDYSKVVVELMGGSSVSVFKVDHCNVIADDQYIFLRKYILIPMSDLNQMNIPEVDFNDLVEYETEMEEEIELPIIRETVTTEVKKLKWDYAPISEVE